MREQVVVNVEIKHHTTMSTVYWGYLLSNKYLISLVMSKIPKSWDIYQPLETSDPTTISICRAKDFSRNKPKQPGRKGPPWTRPWRCGVIPPEVAAQRGPVQDLFQPWKMPW